MKNIPKDARTIATKKGERILIDLSWIKTASFAHNRYWLLILDEYTHFLWSYFLKSKNEQVQVIVKHLIHITNEEKVKVAFIRRDISGENHDLQNQIKDNHPKLFCQFEFTAPDSPQQNGKVERKFTTLFGRVSAMLNEAELNWPLRHAMWAYVSLHATK
jgi:transposase InsO family protein